MLDNFLMFYVLHALMHPGACDRNTVGAEVTSQMHQ